MSPTLVRVQIANMQGNTDAFKDKNVKVFGRALNGSCIQHPSPDTDSFSDDDGFAVVLAPSSLLPHAANENARRAARRMHNNVFFILIFPLFF